MGVPAKVEETMMVASPPGLAKLRWDKAGVICSAGRELFSGLVQNSWWGPLGAMYE